MIKKFKPSVWKRMKLVSKPTDKDAAIRSDDDGVMWRWQSAGKYVTAERVTGEGMKKLPSSAFTWDKYTSQVGFAISQIFADPWHHPTKLCPEVTVVGYCPAHAIPIRPRSIGFAVMLERDGEDFWLHMNDLPGA